MFPYSNLVSYSKCRNKLYCITNERNIDKRSLMHKTLAINFYHNNFHGDILPNQIKLTNQIRNNALTLCSERCNFAISLESINKAK